MIYENDDDYLTDAMMEKTRLLPAWFCRRMAARDGAYVFILSGGVPVVVRRITSIHQDSHGVVWLDVDLLKQSEADSVAGGVGGLCAPIGAVGDQRNATLNSTAIMLAYEIGLTSSPPPPSPPTKDIRHV